MKQLAIPLVVPANLQLPANVDLGQDFTLLFYVRSSGQPPLNLPALATK